MRFTSTIDAHQSRCSTTDCACPEVTLIHSLQSRNVSPVIFKFESNIFLSQYLCSIVKTPAIFFDKLSESEKKDTSIEKQKPDETSSKRFLFKSKAYFYHCTYFCASLELSQVVHKCNDLFWNLRRSEIYIRMDLSVFEADNDPMTFDTKRLPLVSHSHIHTHTQSTLLSIRVHSQNQSQVSNL